MNLLLYGIEHVVSNERRLTGERLVHDATEGIDIGARIQPATHSLLRAHVIARAEALSGFSKPLNFLPALRQDFGHPEIHYSDNLSPAFNLLDHQIARLQVSVDDVVRVRVIHTVAHLNEN